MGVYAVILYWAHMYDPSCSGSTPEGDWLAWYTSHQVTQYYSYPCCVHAIYEWCACTDTLSTSVLTLTCLERAPVKCPCSMPAT